MNKALRKYLVVITLVSLSILLFLQVKWIIYSVKFQEKVFHNSVNLALDKTIAILNNDHTVCSAMRDCMGCGGSASDTPLISHAVWEQIHSTIHHELAAYNIHLDYDLFITTQHNDTLRSGQLDLVVRKGICYTQSLRELLQTSGYELVVRFPNRTRFFVNEAGIMLFSSIILILLIIFSIIRIVGLYRDELRLSENIRDLINNVTHEFKTPISSIALASNLIRKGKPDNGKMQEYGNLIYQENQKLQRQVDSLLDMAAMEWESFEYHKAKLFINDLIKDALGSVTLLVAEKEAIITTSLTGEDVAVEGDRTHLTNAIANLLTNALKYSAGIPEINIRAYTDEKYVYLEVCDKGIGIQAKHLKYIFDKYYRVPTGDVHNIKGFGIGLSYVKSVVTSHKGKVMVSSTPGNGSTFSVILPKTSNHE